MRRALTPISVALGACLAIAAVAVLASTKLYEIPSGSMAPTVDVGERVIVERLPYWLGDPEIGDIVVFRPPAGAAESGRCGLRPKPPDEPCSEPVGSPDEVTFIKRIVATPGDTLAIEDGHAIVNGEAIEEDYIRPCGGSGHGCNFRSSITIPPDHYFMMGDNRGASDDSRFWGPVPREWIDGKAVATYWPPDRIGGL